MSRRCDKRIAALETAAKTTRETLSKNTGTDNAVRLALSAAVLRDAVDARRAVCRRACRRSNCSAAMTRRWRRSRRSRRPACRTKPALARELTALIPAMLKVSGATAPGGSFLESSASQCRQAGAHPPVDAPHGDDASAVLARIEIDAANADIAAALADLDKLPDTARAPAQAWIEKAKARQAALAAARRFAADTARAARAQDGGAMIRVVLFLVGGGADRGRLCLGRRPARRVAITWMGYRIETSVMVAALARAALRDGRRARCGRSCASSCVRPNRCRCFSATAAP